MFFVDAKIIDKIKYAPVAELADALDFGSTTSVKELLISGFPVFIYED